MNEAPLLEIRDLTLTRGERRVLDGFTLSVARGEIHGLLGPNGAGKSSAFSVLIGLLPPSGGELRLEGEAVPFGGSRLKEKMGVVFQHPALDPRLTARTNLSLAAGLYGLGGAERRRRIDEMVAFADLEGRDREPVKKLSGGMRRRLEIARGLLHHPTVLFLDEPTLGLDPQTRNQMWAYLKELSAQEGTTVFFTTHYMDEADRIAQRLAVVDHGKIVAMGAPADVKAEQNAGSLEEAFLALTGRTIREEESSATDRTRMMVRAMRGRRG